MSSPFAHFFRQGLFNSYLLRGSFFSSPPRLVFSIARFNRSFQSIASINHFNRSFQTLVSIASLKRPLAMTRRNACHVLRDGTTPARWHHTTPHHTGTMAPAHGYRHRHRNETTPDTTPSSGGDYYHAHLRRTTSTTAHHQRITIIPTPQHAQVNAQRSPALSRRTARDAHRKTF